MNITEWNILLPNKVKGAAVSLDSFTNYLNKVSTIKNTEDFYSEGQKQSSARVKQIYSVIEDDREITINSGTGFLVTITDAFATNPPIEELADQKKLLGSSSPHTLAHCHEKQGRQNSSN